jgi:ABC-2 type transport system ATP-binding protein
MTAIQVRGLHKSYNGTVAVAGVDLDISEGEVFALLGPNGAGKTTTVEILEGHRRRDSGKVSVLGVDPGSATRAWRARIGIVLQTANDAAELTVRESVRHYAGYYPSPANPDEVIEQVGLTQKADTRVKALSGGQRRSLDVALGVVGRPELVFLDEPTTGFDPQARRDFWTLIRDLATTGTTILLTTHYLEEAEALADRVGVIAGGRLIAVDAPRLLGNRDSAPATVSWRTPDGSWHRAESATPTAFVAGLAERFAGEVQGLTVTRPTLEDVYLSMIGEK